MSQGGLRWPRNQTNPAPPPPTLPHAASHQAGGGDAIKLDDLAAPEDNTDLDASTTTHGLLKKLPGGTTDFLRADGAFASPAGGISGSGTTGKVPKWTSATALGDSVLSEVSNELVSSVLLRPVTNQNADLGTNLINWNTVWADSVIIRDNAALKFQANRAIASAHFQWKRSSTVVMDLNGNSVLDIKQASAAIIMNGTQVLVTQQAAVADATDATTVITQLNALLARLRTHGLIAT